MLRVYNNETSNPPYITLNKTKKINYEIMEKKPLKVKINTKFRREEDTGKMGSTALSVDRSGGRDG